MKILSYLFIALALLGLMYSFTSSLKTTRKISVADRRAYENFESTANNNVPISNDGMVTVKTKNISEFLFLNNPSASLMTVVLGLLIFITAILLLFGPDSTRVKIYQSHSIPYLIGLIICSVVISWFFTRSFVNNPDNDLRNYKYRFNYGDVFRLFFYLLIILGILKRFKHIYNEYTMQSELDRLSQ